MSLIDIKFDCNYKDWADWFAKVPTDVQLEIEQKMLPNVRRKTKTVVRSKLSKTPHGVEKGIYKSSFKINNFADSKWKIGFQVFAGRGHHRLTHLIEGRDDRPGGHRIFLFTRGRGEPTKKGNIGMSWVKTKKRPSGYTTATKHIEPGQKYAEESISTIYHEAPTKILTERLRKL